MGCAERQELSGLCKPFMIPSVLIVFVSSELQVGAPVVYRAFLTIGLRRGSWRFMDAPGGHIHLARAVFFPILSSPAFLTKAE